MISLSDLKRRIDAGELSPDAALTQSLAAIEAQEKTIGAFVHRSATPRNERGAFARHCRRHQGQHRHR